MKVVFYDQDVVTLRAQTLARAWGADRESIGAGTGWEGPEPGSADVLEGWRATIFMDRAMQAVEEVRERAGEDAWFPLGEICRYELCQKLARLIFLRRTVSTLKRLGALEVLVVVDGTGSSSPQTATALAERDSILTVADLSREVSPRKGPGSLREWLYRHLKQPIVNRAHLGLKGYEHPTRRPVLAATEYYPSSVRATGPILKHLQDDGYSVIGVPARLEAQGPLARYGFPQQALRLRRRPRASFGPVVAAMPVVEAFMEFADLPPGVEQRKLLDDITHLLREAQTWLSSYRDLWRVLSPLGVISSTYSGSYARAASIAAHEEGIETFFIQHGALLPCYSYSFFCQRHLLVWGDYFERGLVAQGVEPSRIDVVGPTALEHTREARSKRKLRSPLVKLSSAVVVYLAPRTGGSLCSTPLARQAASLVLAATADAGVGKVILKLHPADRTGEIESLARHWPHAECSRSGRPSEILVDADLAVLTGSTSGYEACLLQVPSVFLRLPGLEDFCEFESFGAAIQVRNRSEFVAVLDSLAHAGDGWARQREAQQKMTDAVLAGGLGDSVENSAMAIQRVLDLR